MKRLSPLAIAALEEALASIFWYKDDLNRFLVAGLGGTQIVNLVSWDPPKRQIVRDLVAILCADQERHQDALVFLLQEVSKFSDFSHLERLDDGEAKAIRARGAVANLREMMKTYEEATAEGRHSAERRQQSARERSEMTAITEKLDELKRRCGEMVTKLTPQKRGFELEKLMYDLFALFDLDPKASFRILGEQIDGAFSLEGLDYLFEAKWAGLVSAAEMDTFAAKVQRRLDNTLGLMLSMDGFQPDGVQAHSKGRPVIFLMTGADLMAVLEGRITFPELLIRKRRHASQTGNILIQFFEM